MAKKSKFSYKSNFMYMDFDGSKLVKAIEGAGGNIKPALEAAAKKSIPIFQKEFAQVAQQHEVTGQMAEALIDPSQVTILWGKEAKKRWVGSTTKGKKGFTGGRVEVVSEDDVMFYEYGFDLDKAGGAHALWLDIGTPKRDPKYGVVKGNYFVFYTINNNMSKVHAIQNKELSKILEGLK